MPVLRALTLAGLAFLATSATADPAWRPVVDLGDLFPSYILATATAHPPITPPPTYIGDPFGLVGVEVRTDQPSTKVRLTIDLQQIADTTDYEALLPSPGTYRIYPKIHYRYQTLAAIRQPITINASISLSLDGQPANVRSEVLRVRSVNDAVIAVATPNGQAVSKAWSLVSFVNENHPAIDNVLRAALNIPVPIVREFVGYQQGPQVVVNQVFAIWYLFERSGFTYSSITTASGYTDKVNSQTVRFVEDSLRTRQSNCIDGTVLFASILRKIGIDPILVLLPDHAFLGFWLDAQHTTPAFLETTLMNSPANPYRNAKPTKFRDAMARTFQTDFKLQQASIGFNAAISSASDRYNSILPNLKARAPGYYFLDVATYRKVGIQPINH